MRIGFRNEARRACGWCGGEDGRDSEGRERAPEEWMRRGGVCTEVVVWMRRWQTA